MCSIVQCKVKNLSGFCKGRGGNGGGRLDAEEEAEEEDQADRLAGADGSGLGVGGDYVVAVAVLIHEALELGDGGAELVGAVGEGAVAGEDEDVAFAAVVDLPERGAQQVDQFLVGHVDVGQCVALERPGPVGGGAGGEEKGDGHQKGKVSHGRVLGVGGK